MFKKLLFPDDGAGGGGDQAAKDLAAKAVADKVIADKAIADQKVIDDKTAADKKAADDLAAKGGKDDKGKTGDGVPDKYDLKLPDGSKLGQADIEATAAFAKENGLTQGQAENLLKSREEALTATRTAETEAIKQSIEGWEGSIRADKTLGATYEDTVRIAGQGFERAFPGTVDAKGVKVPSEISTFLKISGLGSHPDVVRHFFKFGLESGEDQHKRGSGNGDAPKKTAAQRMYATLPSEAGKQ